MPQAGIPTPREGIGGFGRNAGGETPELFQLVARPLKETNSYKGAILCLQFDRLWGAKSARDSDNSNGMSLRIGLRSFTSLIGAKAETLCLTEIELRVMRRVVSGSRLSRSLALPEEKEAFVDLVEHGVIQAPRLTPVGWATLRAADDDKESD